jgi:hypothetical protein
VTSAQSHQAEVLVRIRSGFVVDVARTPREQDETI